MNIKTAKYIISSPNFQKCPKPDMPEYAFIGRSNVGKSSLINALTNHSKLAMTSETPGKTKLINHFLINDSWYLVDLPGYGYAKMSKTDRVKLESMNRGYVANRPNLMCLFILIDIRHEAQKIDLEFLEWVAQKKVPMAMVFTKADKIKETLVERQVENYKEVMLQSWEEMPLYFITSAEKRMGMEGILELIVDTNETFDPEQGLK
jgi:GTP-binding protein